MINTVSAASFGTGTGSRFNVNRLARRLLCAGLLVLAPAMFGQGAPFTFSTISGVAAKSGSANGTGGGSNLPLFNNPFGVVLNSAGNLYVADANNGLIRVVTPGGVVTTFAGNPGLTGSVDGAASAATVSFNSPQGLALDSAGNLFVSDYNGHTIRKITPAGVVSTIAGLSLIAGITDATGVDARFNKPAALAVDSAGNLYVADSGSHTIRKITSAGVVTTYAGKAGVSGGTDGALTDARFNNPRGLVVDAAGNLYVADTNNNSIRKITPAGSVSTLAGAAGTAGATNGTGAAARFNTPLGLALDSSGNLIVADLGNNLVRKVTPAGAVTTVAGSAGVSGKVDGTGTAAQFNGPIGVAVDSSGNIYVTDYSNALIRKITSAGVVSTIAGVGGTTGFLDGSGYNLSAALFANPNGLAIGPGSFAYVADTGNNVIRRIAADGTVTTYAGSTTTLGSTDGALTDARFNLPGGVAADSNGDLYVADTSNHLIRKISAAGNVSTFAGTALSAGSADGSGANARFSFPSGVALDLSSNVYVADYDNNTIRKITPAGVVSTLAGSAGAAGSTDGSGSTARFNSPRSLAVDAAGVVYVADTGNHVIRKIAVNGTVTTLAGSAGNAGSADGTGSAARFDSPAGITVTSSGTVYVSDSNNSTIRAVTSAGVVTTVGGSAGAVGAKDGVGSAARFNHPAGLALDAAGNLYVADNRNQTIRLGLASGNTSGIGTGGGGSGGGSGSGSAGSGSGSGSAGNGTSNGTDTGSGTGSGTTSPSAAFLLHPGGLTGDGVGGYYIADTANNSIKHVASDGTVTTFAGKEGSAGSTDGTGTAALFNGPKGITADAVGNLYVADTGNATIRKITTAGVVTTLAGAAGSRGTTDGTGSAALFNTPTGIVFNNNDAKLYVTDSVNCTIRRITSDSGVVTTLAGTAKAVGDADGIGSAARFNNPSGIAIDPVSLALCVADTYNNTIRKIETRRIVRATAAGTIVTAGNATVVLTDPGISGSPITFSVAVVTDDVDATWAAKVVTAMTANTTVNARYSVTASGAVITLAYLGSITDDQTAANLSLTNGTCTGIIAAPTSVATAGSGTVTTLAGSAGISGVYDGTGPFALFNLPQGLGVDGTSNIYVADTGNNSIRRVTSRGVVTTLAGISGITGSRDGAGNTALFNQPQGVALGSTIVVLDTGNSSIRFVVPGTSVVSTMTLKAPTTTTTTTDTSSSSGGGGAPSTWFLGALSLLAAGRLLDGHRRKPASQA